MLVTLLGAVAALGMYASITCIWPSRSGSAAPRCCCPKPLLLPQASVCVAARDLEGRQGQLLAAGFCSWSPSGLSRQTASGRAPGRRFSRRVERRAAGRNWSSASLGRMASVAAVRSCGLHSRPRRARHRTLWNQAPRRPEVGVDALALLEAPRAPAVFPDSHVNGDGGRLSRHNARARMTLGGATADAEGKSSTVRSADRPHPLRQSAATSYRSRACRYQP